MTARPHNFLAASSVLLLALILAAWGRSYWRKDVAWLSVGGRMFVVGSSDGQLGLATGANRGPRDPGAGWDVANHPDQLAPYTEHHLAHFGVTLGTRGQWMVCVPDWFAAALAGIVPALWLRRRRRGRRGLGAMAFQVITLGGAPNARHPDRASGD